jgi:signal transduction histidine kinase
VLLEFADDGRGMAPEVAAHAFDPFFTTTLGRGGSGLGLYIVYNLVTGPLGGEIRLRSTPGAGTRYQLYIPRSAPAPEMKGRTRGNG